MLPLWAHCQVLAVLCHAVGEFEHRDVLLRAAEQIQDEGLPRRWVRPIIRKLIELRADWREQVAERLGLTIHN